MITTSDYDYDGAARLTALNHSRNSTILAGYNYTWDAADRITNMDFSPSSYNAEDAAFNYDAAGQLEGAQRSDTANDETYLYDDNGNRDTVSRDGAANQDWQIGVNNRLTDDGTFTYTYDDEGNRLTKVRKSSANADDKTVTYTWDYRNRLSTVTFKRNDTTVTKTVDYSYDMFNRWTKRVLDSDGALGSATLIVDDFMHDAEEKIVHTSSQMVGRSHVYLHGPLQDQVLFDEVAAGLRITLADHLNTVRDVYDISGNLLNHVTYDSFGRRIAETNTTIEVFYGFTGRPYDEDTGLGNHLNRWYDSNGGKWISEDPIGFEGGLMNLVSYVGNQVTVAIDPHGLAVSPLEVAGGVMTVVDLWTLTQDNEGPLFEDLRAGGTTPVFNIDFSTADLTTALKAVVRRANAFTRREEGIAGRDLTMSVWLEAKLDIIDHDVRQNVAATITKVLPIQLGFDPREGYVLPQSTTARRPYGIQIPLWFSAKAGRGFGGVLGGIRLNEVVAEVHGENGFSASFSDLYNPASLWENSKVEVNLAGSLKLKYKFRAGPDWENPASRPDWPSGNYWPIGTMELYKQCPEMWDFGDFERANNSGARDSGEIPIYSTPGGRLLRLGL